MPDGKIISVQPGEYPEIDGLKEGSMVKFEGEAQLVKGGLQITNIQMEPSDNDATQEINRMTGNDSTTPAPSNGGSVGF